MTAPLPDRRVESQQLPALPLWCLLVVLAAGLAHAPGLRSEWTFDDARLVRDNPAVEAGWSGARTAFGREGWTAEQDAGAWRPLTVLSFCLEAPLWPSEDGRPAPFGFHVVNLALHGLAALLLLLLLLRCLPGWPVVGVASALLLAVHPLHAGTVGLLVGRADLLALVLVLGALLLWERSIRRGSILALPLAGLLGFLAVLAKETALVLPVALVALEAASGGRGTWRRRAVGWAVLLLGYGLFAFRWPGPFVGVGEALCAGSAGLGRAVLGTFVPVDPIRDRALILGADLSGDVTPAAVIAGLAFACVALVTLVHWIVRRRGGPLAAACGVTAAAVVLGALVAPRGAPLEARFAYLLTPALLLLPGGLLAVLAPVSRVSTGLRSAVSGTGAVAAVVMLGILTWSEYGTYGSASAERHVLLERAAWRADLLVRESRRLREATAAERAFWTDRPITATARDALRETVQANLGESEMWLRVALRRIPRDQDPVATARAYRELGFTLYDVGRVPQAREVLRAALYHDERLEAGLRPVRELDEVERAQVVETWMRMAAAETLLDEDRTAARYLQSAVELAPRDPDVLRAASRALTRVGDFREGLLLLLRALDAPLSPEDRKVAERELEQTRRSARAAAERHMKEARAAESRADYRDASAAYQAALDSDPTVLQAYWSLAYLQGVWFGDHESAQRLLDQAEVVLTETGDGGDGSWHEKIVDLRARIEKQRREDEDGERDEGLDPNGDD